MKLTADHRISPVSGKRSQSIETGTKKILSAAENAGFENDGTIFEV